MAARKNNHTAQHKNTSIEHQDVRAIKKKALYSIHASVSRNSIQELDIELKE